MVVYFLLVFTVHTHDTLQTGHFARAHSPHGGQQVGSHRHRGHAPPFPIGY